jgi:hypothetical protein
MKWDGQPAMMHFRPSLPSRTGLLTVVLGLSATVVVSAAAWSRPGVPELAPLLSIEAIAAAHRASPVAGNAIARTRTADRDTTVQPTGTRYVAWRSG